MPYIGTFASGKELPELKASLDLIRTTADKMITAIEQNLQDIPVLKQRLEFGDKLLLINELLATVKKDEDGKPQMTAEQKKLFILLGEKLPDQKSLIQEYNPEIRTGQIREAMELALSLLSMMFGYGTKKYTFENTQIQTATQYIGERQDEMERVILRSILEKMNIDQSCLLIFQVLLLEH